jgi:hypothetical protein
MVPGSDFNGRWVLGVPDNGPDRSEVPFRRNAVQVAAGKKPRRTGNWTCKPAAKEVNHEKAYASRGQETKWEIPVKTKPKPKRTAACSFPSAWLQFL